MNATRNNEKLTEMLSNIFLLEEHQCVDDMNLRELDTWDSLATVSLAIGLNDEFEHLMSPQDVEVITKIGDVKQYLRGKGVSI